MGSSRPPFRIREPTEDRLRCLLLHPRPGGAHEKGGVEHEGGRFRRTHLVPVPDVASLEELNEKITEIDAAEDARILQGRLTTIGFNFIIETDQLAPCRSRSSSAASP